MWLERFTHAMCVSDLFSTFNSRKLKFRRKLTDKYGAKNKKHLCVQVFNLTVLLIILDIIQNNTTFALPLFNKRHGIIYMQPIVGDRLKEICQKNGFRELDLLTSNFTGYRLTFQFKSGAGELKEKLIYVSSELKKMITDNVNHGKQYY